MLSCTNIEKTGYMFEFSDYDLLKEAVFSKDRVLKNMGSPSLISDIGDDQTWIYLSQDVEKILFLKPKVIKRQILTLKFDKENMLEEIHSYDIGSQGDIKFSSLHTEVKSIKKSFFKDIFSNIGQVRPQ